MAGETLRWRENPGDDSEWSVHDVDRCGSIETIRFCDVDGCGTVEGFPNTPGEPAAFYKLARDGGGAPTDEFEKYVIGEGPAGQVGFGDVNGNGRPDVVLADSWLECPADPLNAPWTFHQEFDFGHASVPILAHVVTGDRRTDLIVGQAHDYGLSWWEQRDEGAERTWIEHEIDADRSQYHDMRLVDIDYDGDLELVTGKRYRAHCGDGPGSDDPLGIYYFDIDGGDFDRHVVDYGPAGEGAGCGIYFWLADVTGNGRSDIVAPGKDGLHLYENRP